MTDQKYGAGKGERRRELARRGTWEKGNRTATCLQVVSQSSSRPPLRNPQSGHPCNNMAATGERDKERQTNRRKKERKQRVSNRIGRYGHMLSPSSVTSLSVIPISIILHPSGWLQNIQKTRPSTRQAYTWNHIFKTHREGSSSSFIDTCTFLSL